MFKVTSSDVWTLDVTKRFIDEEKTVVLHELHFSSSALEWITFLLFFFFSVLPQGVRGGGGGGGRRNETFDSFSFSV